MDDRTLHGRSRKIFAIAVAAGTISYVVLAITGAIKPVDRLTASEFGLVLVSALVVGVAWKPDLLDRLQRFDFAGMKFELSEVKRGQLEVQKNQQQQLAVLDDVRLALRLLISDKERSHLRNLFNQKTTYQVTGHLRDEIRRLRAMSLVKMRGDRTVSGMSEGVTFNLADFVELTEDGFQFVSRLYNEPEAQAKTQTATGQ